MLFFATLGPVPAGHVTPWLLPALAVAFLAVLVCCGLSWVSRIRHRVKEHQWHTQMAMEERARADRAVFAGQLIASQEQERERIAHEMHDSLGQDLLVIKNLAVLGASLHATSPAVAAKFEEISAVVTNAITEVRRISYGLRPEELDRLGLTKAIAAMVSRAGDSASTRFTLELDNIDRLLPPGHEIDFYRVVQEGTNNILKHSKAPCACITIQREADRICLTIHDNGQGFDREINGHRPVWSQGFGLSGIAERIRILGGELELDAKAGAGTSIHAWIPIAIPPA